MLITIGKVIRPWGIKGELKIEPLTDFLDRFKNVGRVFLVSPSGKELTCDVISVRYANKIPYLVFDGYNSPEQAKVFNGWFVKVPREEVVPLPEGSYYRFELYGMEVFSEEGMKLGTITDIFATGSNDVYVMTNDDKETYIPATREVIKKVDKAAKKIVIHLIDGMME
ncbi:MAG TPA: ribosome maturation factor RimM [Nitrospirota bacterium]|nr:ribosome maturation factor RimM [Nitrospirota bacterium]